MSSPALTAAHIEAQAHLRGITVQIIGRTWAELGHWDDADVQTFLERALPVVAGAQRTSSELTARFVAACLRVPPFGVDPALVSGAACRNGTPPSEVYRRPFVSYWTDLKRGRDWQGALAAGQARAEATAATDVQLTSRATFQQAQLMFPPP